MKIAQILNTRHITHLLIGFLLVATLGACSDEGDRDKDVFGFEGNKDEILSIEVTNTQNESLRFKTNQTQSIFKSETQRPTLLFFISKDCIECQNELLHILDLYNKYQEFISIIAISPKEDITHLQQEIDALNPQFKLYTPTDNKNLLNFLKIGRASCRERV